MKAEPKHFAVMGTPIAHSLSPHIHAAFAKQTNCVLRYEALEVDSPSFEKKVRSFFSCGGTGLNVTLPFKERAAQLADSQSEEVLLCQAANTLMYRNNTIYAHNTDGLGWLADITRLGWQLTGAGVVVLGAGGAVAGIMPQLLHSNIAWCCVCNRTPDRAKQLVRQFMPLARKKAVKLSSDTLESAASLGADMVVNALSVGADYAYTLSKPRYAYDLSYKREADTTFCAAARHSGCKHVSDGLGMLVYQAAESFTLWHGVSPQVLPVLQQLRTYESI